MSYGSTLARLSMKSCRDCEYNPLPSRYLIGVRERDHISSGL
jgi:hypothetical protein